MYFCMDIFAELNENGGFECGNSRSNIEKRNSFQRAMVGNEPSGSFKRRIARKLGSDSTPFEAWKGDSRCLFDTDFEKKW